MAPTIDAAKSRGSKRLNYRRWRDNRAVYRAKQPVLPSAWHITILAARIIWNYRNLLIGIVLFYGLANLLLVQGLASNTDVATLKSELSKTLHGNFSDVSSSLTIFIVLIGSSGSGSSATAGAYQVILILIVSLALIWSLRQVLSGTVVSIRDAYYKGVTPLVPVVLVLLVMGLQLIPLAIGASLYSTVIRNGIAVATGEKLILAGIFAVLSVISLYWVTSSVFALYIVTLPGMTPMKALRSARELVRYRRLLVVRKILFLPLILLVMAACIMVPIIGLLTPLSQWVFFVVTMLALAAIHTYMYSLYRELLHE
jgi:hypothetical protein